MDNRELKINKYSKSVFEPVPPVNIFIHFQLSIVNYLKGLLIKKL